MAATAVKMHRPALRHANHGRHVLLPGFQSRRRDADHFVAFTSRHLRQFPGREDQQMAVGRDGGDPVGLQVEHPDRRQYLGPDGYDQQGLSAFLAALHVLQASDEAVAMAGGDQIVRRLAGHGDEGGAVGGAETAGQGLALAAGGG